MVFEYSVLIFEYIQIFVLGDHASVGSGDRFSVVHWTYPDTGIVHDQFEALKVRFEVSINYSKLGSLYVKCFLTICNSRRRPSICKFKLKSVCVTCQTRSQHESIDSIVKTESSSN